MADTICGIFIFYGLVFGLRRGFYKELVSFGALVMGALAARALKNPVGGAISGTLGIGPTATEFVAALAIFLLIALIVNVVGRVILNKLKNPDGENKVEEGADELADALADKGKKGPMTLLTDPIAKATSGVVYWSDKLLGAVLGIAKSIVAVAVVFMIVSYWSIWTGSDNALAKSIDASYSHRVFHEYVEPQLAGTSEFRLVRNLECAYRIAEVAHGDAKKVQKIANSPAVQQLRSNPRVQALATDPKIRDAWARGDVKTLIFDPKVRDLLSDPDFRAAFSDADLDAVLGELVPATTVPKDMAPPPPPSAPSPSPSPSSDSK